MALLFNLNNLTGCIPAKVKHPTSRVPNVNSELNIKSAFAVIADNNRNTMYQNYHEYLSANKKAS